MDNDGFTFRQQLSAMARERLKFSGISEIIALVESNGALSFGAGEPPDEAFPRDAFRSAVERALSDGTIWAYYHDDLGDLDLRAWIAERMSRDDMAPDWVGPEDVVITHGAAGAISLAAEALIDEGAVVLVEGPTYSDSLLTFRRQGAICVPVPTDDEGILPEELERTPQLKEARFLYTIPNFQNPGGCTASLERRLRVLDILRRHDIAILEDDPYHYLGYDGPVPTSYLKLAGDDRRVIHCNSFSKIVAPGLRIGWAVVPPALRDVFLALCICDGLGPALLMQRAILHLMRTLDFEKHVEGLRRQYRNRRDTMLHLAEERLTPFGLRTNRPKGGFFIWGQGPDDMRGFNSAAFARYAVQHKGIGLIPGSVFFPDGDDSGDRAFRLSYARIPLDCMGEGMDRLARAWRTYRAHRHEDRE